MSGLLIFSRLKSGTILFLLVAYGLLLHSYLPLSHILFYSGDGWRHIAVENNLLSQTVSQIFISPDQPISFWQRFDFGSLAYAQFNAIALFLKTLGGVELLNFMRWFIPVTWSVVLPIVLFEIAHALNWEKKNALFLVWLTALPFALQVSGSFTLPSNLGVLFWLVCLLLQIKLSQQNSLAGNIFLIFLGLISIFGYSLYFILFWLSFVLIKLSRLSVERKGFCFVATVLATLCLPAIELISHFSVWKEKINWLGQIKAVVINFTGWIISFDLRANDTTAGNIIFNQPSAVTIVRNIFTVYPQWIFIFMSLFWIVYLVAVYKMHRTKDRLNNFWLQISFGLLGSYIISRYFLGGENIFTRRLDAVLAILIILPLSKILYDFCVQQSSSGKKLSTFLVILVLSVAVTASYTLGPDASILSGAEYSAADNVWTREKNNDQKICVLAESNPLFVLEALSAKKVVGGGFPINSFFAQPEYVQILAQSKSDPIGAVAAAKQLLNVSSCYLVGDYDLPNPLSKFENIKVYKF
ncbi:MAG: hypothetical protein ACD_72C00471G0001 [uncultured bacterium]|nr:MAG: hypothetical protein ACD_72C00471G0001 [uncultured bacterium]